jgi:CHAT domain-containing protein
MYARLSTIAFTAALCVLFTDKPAAAQLGRGEIPNTEYWLARSLYYNGDFSSAGKGYREAARGAVLTPHGRWVDSICFHTMLGECFYEMGDLTQALDQYSAALKLFLAHQNWMLSVEFPPAVDPAAPPAPITWGTPTRPIRLGKFPPRYPLLRDTISIVTSEGGGASAVTGKEAIPVRAHEIARCTALAIKRRREIMGSVCQRDRLTDQVLTALMRRPAPPNSWSHCWVSVQLGLAYSAAGKQTEAMSELAKGVTAGGTYDHILTSLALLEMADIYFSQGKYDLAGTHYLEATYSAAMHDQYDDMEAGFRGAQLCWLVTGQKTPFLPLAPATAWANKKDVRKLEVALRLLAAENLTLIGDTAGAATLLATAQKAMLRREMQLGRPGARWQFEMARVQFANGAMGDGVASLATAMKFQQASSKWLFQIGLAHTMTVGRVLTEREADILYTELLREPTAADWAIDPLESLTVVSTSYPAALESWFGVALARKEPEKAMEIADRLRRHRFYSTLPLGGRLLALRWVLEAPKDLLDDKAQLQRQDLLVKYPAYADLSTQAAAVKAQLAEFPLLPTDDAEKKKQADLLRELGKISTLQEVALRNIALRRDPSDFVFPPPLNVKQLQSEISDRTLVLSYINIGGQLFGFAVGKERYASFPVETVPRLKSELTTILKAWGNLEKNQTVSAKELQNTEWKEPARRLLKTLTNNMKDENWAMYDELIVVPDSVLWYVPFESFPLGDGPDAPLLISRTRVRYVPTMSLARPDRQPKTPLDRTAVVAGKLFPRDDVAIAAGEYDKITAHLPHAARLMNNLPVASSLFASQLDQLIVYHDLDESAKGPYDWSPLPVDKTKAGSAIGEWFSLPWESPRQVILPGFHTPAEASFRRGGAGDELFLTACAFLASGSKTVLLSRWRTGGQTSYDLMREFALESPYSSASAAWQRSVQLAMHAPLDPQFEPRLQTSDDLDGATAAHPFFWSGYLLIDTGAVVPEDKPAREAAPPPKLAEEPAADKPDADEPGDMKDGEKTRTAELDEEDGKLPPELEALRGAPPDKVPPGPMPPAAEAAPQPEAPVPADKPPLKPRPARKSR